MGPCTKPVLNRRRIPREMWDGYSPTMRALLRCAAVEGRPDAPRSVLGSVILATAGAVFAARVWQVRAFSKD